MMEVEAYSASWPLTLALWKRKTGSLMRLSDSD
jgi:hypothetical protein